MDKRQKPPTWIPHQFLRSQHIRSNIWLFVFLTVLFLILTFFVVSDRSSEWDLYVSAVLQNQQSETTDAVMKGFSWLGNVRIAFFTICIASLFFMIAGKRKEALLMLSTVLTGAVSWVLKMLINRPRPGTDFVRVIEETRYQSFPSGHVLFYTVFFGLLSIVIYDSRNLDRTFKTACISLFALMLVFGAASRIYLGAHWLTDVLGGLIIGIQFLLVARPVYLYSGTAHQPPQNN